MALALGETGLAQPSQSLLDDKAAFSILSITDGLPSASVSGIVQDSKGFIWLATQGGLSRYDGSGFKSWENEPFDENSLSGDLIQTIFRDKDDSFWLGTYNGLNYFNSNSERFTHYRYSTEKPDSLSNDLVIAIARDARGRLWVGTLNGLNRLDEATGTFIRYFHDDKDPHSIPNNVIRSLLLDAKGRLWVGTTGGGLATYDYELNRFDNHADMSPPPPASTQGPPRVRKGFPPSASVQSISEDSSGNLWVGAWGTGLVRYAPDADSSTVYSLPDARTYVVNTQEEGTVYVGSWGGGLFMVDALTGSTRTFKTSLAVGAIPNDVVYSILLDASDELWVGTNGGGLARLDRTRRSFKAWVSDPADPRSLPNGKVLASLVDSKGRLWVSVYSNGIHVLDPATGAWRHFRHSDKDPRSLGDDICNTIYEDRQGGIWACTNVGLSRYEPSTGGFTTYRHVEGDPDSLSSSIIYSVLEDPKGNLWVGTYMSGLDYWDRTTGRFSHNSFSPKDPYSISDNLVMALAYGPDGKLWVGTNNGLNRLEDGRFVRYAYDPANLKGLSSSAIFRIVLDTKGIMWVATRGGGLNRYDKATDSFTHFMRRDGLPSNIVYTALEDRTGNLWVVTQTGLALLDRQAGTVKRVTLYRELSNASFTSGSSTGPGGELYFGSMGMLVKFDPALYDRNTHIPPVFITELRAANRSRLPAPAAEGKPGAIRLATWENSIEIRFAALDFRDPKGNQFAYKLEGFDKDWSYSSTRNFATYTNLPGGNYVFRVKAANNDGVWNDKGAALPLTVETSPFLTPPAFVIYLLALVFLGYALANLRSNRILALKVKELTAAQKALNAANEESRRLAKEADDANKAKSEFIATMSHEIRTPIHGVVGMAEVLSRSRLDRVQAEDVETIKRSGESLLKLINQVLDFSKLEADKLTLEEIPFDLPRLLSETGDFFSRLAGDKGLSFELACDPALPAFVRGDPLRLRQVLNNLLGNAVKFTDRGKVRLIARPAGDVAGAKAAIHFRVEDSGIGISEGQRATLFMPFSQADQSTTRRYGGTGLGLSISKRYVELMGGSLGLESGQGQGSAFFFTIPLEPATRAEPARALAETAARHSLVAAQVLVVDDDEVNRRVATSFLAELGADSSEVESGPAAIVELGKRRYDLVLIDCMMPAMDGFETTRRIRDPGSGALDPTVAVVAMTACAQPEDRQRCLEAGMDDYILKPFSLRELEDTMIRALAARRGTKMSAAAGAAPGGMVPAAADTEARREGSAPAGGAAKRAGALAPVFDEEEFSSRYKASPDLARQILELFLEQTRPLLAEALSAPPAEAPKAVADVLHRIKGSAGAIGGTKLSREASALYDDMRAGGGGLPEAARMAAFEADLGELEARLRLHLSSLAACEEAGEDKADPGEAGRKGREGSPPVR
jgi:signal transduction histidine kinase/ligand-binding sensor domain-containing protein/DNA-binding response OmpR family regulator/HPt (histidine-containing phosphotransfer) domain-containing protein